MIRGITTFKCTQCGEKFKAMDIEFCATAFSQPARCPKCGSYRTRPSSFFDIFGWGDDSSYEEIWKMMEKNRE